MFHAKNFINYHKKKSTKLKKYSYDTRHRLEWVERNEQKKKDHIKKKRMAALKNDRFDEYLSLIKKEKNNRLHHIIQQTNQYLNSLTKRLVL